MTELTYEPTVIEEHARRLNRRADSMGVTGATIGVVVGGFVGCIPLTSLGAAWPIPGQFGIATLLAGVLLGAALGYVVGDGRAFGYRLQAQRSLCQLQLERNMAALLSSPRLDVPRARLEPATQQPAEAVEPVEAATPAPAAEPVRDLDSMSIMEIARLADSGLLR